MKSSKQNKTQRGGKSTAPSKTKPAVPRAVIVVLAVAVVAALVVWWNQARHPDATTAESPRAEAVATNTAVSPRQATVDFQKLKGKWLRPDGGYVIEIKNVEEDGKLSAAYLNPQPINVSKALASQEGSTTKVFIELRDVNYPGSTYTLTYLPEKDLLVGIYYQALQQQSYEVYFERMK